MSKKDEIIGMEGYNKYGSLMKIIKCINTNKILILFPDYNYSQWSSYYNFQRGAVKSPYCKTVFNIGYLGEGSYNKTSFPKIYSHWFAMLNRCYNACYINQTSYLDCTVCEEWHNFQNFAKWYEENYYEVKDEIMHLDKDILLKGNKIYSPQTCIFVPAIINMIFVSSKKTRGNYPIGISYHKHKHGNDKLDIRCNIIDKEKKKTKTIVLKSVPTDYPIEKAFNIYKNFKEEYIKEIADEYKCYIPIELYEALYRYKVEITD